MIASIVELLADAAQWVLPALAAAAIIAGALVLAGRLSNSTHRPSRR